MASTLSISCTVDVVICTAIIYNTENIKTTHKVTLIEELKMITLDVFFFCVGENESTMCPRQHVRPSKA